MQTHVDFQAIQGLFENARKQNRDYLFEYEVYDLIQFSGSETPPAYYVLARNDRLDKQRLEEVPGEKIVVKIISRYVLHKSDVDGIAIVNKSVEDILSTVRRMYYEVPASFKDIVRKGRFELPEKLQGLEEERLEQIVADSIEGVVLCQYMHPDSQEFGNELLVSLRQTREFGMIISAGLGGTDTELYASRFKKGQAVVAASTQMVNGQVFFELFKNTISYKKLAGLTRGQQRIVTDEQLLECFSAVIEVGNHFSPLNPNAPYVIDELEINPFAFSNYLMLPLDGLCRFTDKQTQRQRRPVRAIDKLLHPQKIAIVGVSSQKMNIGRIILQNVTELGFDAQRILLVHPGVADIDGIKTVSEISEISEKIDLMILAVPAAAAAHLVKQVIANDLAEAVILIPGGIGDYNTQESELIRMHDTLESTRKKGVTTPAFLGGNSLGVLSRPGGYDALFIPKSKLPKTQGKHQRRSALVSQSGAYMITRMSKLSFLDPAYAVSIGNQIDLTAGDFLEYFKNIDFLYTIAFYIEGFVDLDGLAFSEHVKQAVSARKEIIFYKAGRTAEGKTAMSGHTASIAGDYMVCESCIGQAGAFVAETFTEFEGLLCLSNALHDKIITDNKLAAVSNAGYEAVGIADNIMGDDYSLEMAKLERDTIVKLDAIIEKAGLSTLVHTANPMDVTPMASEEVYTGIIRTLLEDNQVDVVVVAIVPLTPILHTLPDEHIGDEVESDGIVIVDQIASLNDSSDKPLIMVVDSGPLYDHLANSLEQRGLPVFRSADQAVRVVGKYVQKRLELQMTAE
ncbi:MAG: acetate--CoA ligase family protein [Desulfocapsaceae bacterium]|nr:acetate--CoA ligase family protein [Desulfocapsaceae bacterium]